jgi:hypothetical protein
MATVKVEVKMEERHHHQNKPKGKEEKDKSFKKVNPHTLLNLPGFSILM